MAFSTLFESEKIAKFNLLDLLIVFSAMWIACASAVNMVENLGKEAEDVVPSEKVAAPTPSLFLDPSVYRYVHWEYFSSRISWNFFWYIMFGVKSFGNSVRSRSRQ